MLGFLKPKTPERKLASLRLLVVMLSILTALVEVGLIGFVFYLSGKRTELEDAENKESFEVKQQAEQEFAEAKQRWEETASCHIVQCTDYTAPDPCGIKVCSPQADPIYLSPNFETDAFYVDAKLSLVHDEYKKKDEALYAGSLTSGLTGVVFPLFCLIGILTLKYRINALAGEIRSEAIMRFRDTLKQTCAAVKEGTYPNGNRAELYAKCYKRHGLLGAALIQKSGIISTTLGTEKNVFFVVEERSILEEISQDNKTILERLSRKEAVWQDETCWKAKNSYQSSLMRGIRLLVNDPLMKQWNFRDLLDEEHHSQALQLINQYPAFFRTLETALKQSLEEQNLSAPIKLNYLQETKLQTLFVAHERQQSQVTTKGYATHFCRAGLKKLESAWPSAHPMEREREIELKEISIHIPKSDAYSRHASSSHVTKISSSSLRS